MPVFLEIIIVNFLEIIIANLSENHISEFREVGIDKMIENIVALFLKILPGIFYLVVRRPMLYSIIYNIEWNLIIFD